MKPRPPRPIDEELATFAADPELAEMFITDAIDQLGTIEGTILKLEASPGDLSLVNEIFRPFHTVKANAGVLGITSIQEFAHKVETLLDRARSGQHPMGPGEIDLVLQTVDLLTRIVTDLPARAAGKRTADVTRSRQELMARIDLLLSASPAPVENAELPAHVALALLDEAPAANRWDDAHSTVKVGTRKLDDLVEMVGELVIAQTILAGEPALLHANDERLARRLAHVRRITSALQRDTMAMRMVPIRPTFQKMGRLLRDLSRTFDKPVTLVLTGEETELDRKVVEHLTDPLTHMIRNAVDHGIEPAGVRRAAGKPAAATLRLSAFHRAGCIVVEVADDGAGLHTDAIVARAKSLGMVAESAQLSAAEAHQLIFRPGFSTTSQVTEVSGRGVGLDVVRRNLEALRGRVEIQTTRGKGTTFSLQLPLTLAIVDGLVLGVGHDRFVIPAPAVQESLRPLPGQVHGVHGRARMLQVRDRLIPLLHLGDAFGIAGARQSITESTVVIAEDAGRRIALIVDELLGKQEVVIKGLGDMFHGVRGIAGGAILGDGRIRLILDTGGLLTLLGENRIRGRGMMLRHQCELDRRGCEMDVMLPHQDTAAPRMPAAAHAGKYLTFRLGEEEYGLPVVKVREIIKIMDITQVPQVPAYVLGVINLRGKVIPVIDLRRKFGLPIRESTEQTCIIVAEVNLATSRVMTGVVVDAVSEVLTVAAAEIDEPPEFGGREDGEYLLGLAKVKGSVKILLDLDQVLGRNGHAVLPSL